MRIALQFTRAQVHGVSRRRGWFSHGYVRTPSGEHGCGEKRQSKDALVNFELSY
jgi:hypothetical protein